MVLGAMKIVKPKKKKLKMQTITALDIQPGMTVSLSDQIWFYVASVTVNDTDVFIETVGNCSIVLGASQAVTLCF